MRKSYVIQWKSKVNGRTGRGRNLFELEEAERLAEELNREYPAIDHEVVDTSGPGEPPAAPEKLEKPSQGEPEESEINHRPDHELAFQ